MKVMWRERDEMVNQIINVCSKLAQKCCVPMKAMKYNNTLFFITRVVRNWLCVGVCVCEREREREMEDLD